MQARIFNAVVATAAVSMAACGSTGVEHEIRVTSETSIQNPDATQTSVQLATGFSPETYLVKNDRGSEVLLAKKILNDIGCSMLVLGEGQLLNVDINKPEADLYDESTENVVKYFQIQHDQFEDGETGPETIRALNHAVQTGETACKLVVPLPTSQPAAATATAESSDVINHGLTDKPEIALTFDADMTPNMLQSLTEGKADTWYNKRVIDLLRAYNAPATLFLTGLWAETYPVDARELAADPLFEIGNHSYKHHAFIDDCYKLPSIQNDENSAEIDKSQQVIHDITGVTPSLFRFPGLCHDEVDVRTVAEKGLKIIDGTPPADPGEQDEHKIANQILEEAENGSIIILHMHGSGGLGKGAPKSAEALELVLPELKKRFKLVTVSEVLD